MDGLNFMENPMKMDDLRGYKYHYFRISIHIYYRGLS